MMVALMVVVTPVVPATCKNTLACPLASVNAVSVFLGDALLAACSWPPHPHPVQMHER